MKFIKTALIASLALGSTILLACKDDVQAQTPTIKSQVAHHDGVAKALQENLKKSGVDLTVQTATATEIPSLYLATFDNAPAMFTDKEGGYLIQGQVVKLGDKQPIDIGARASAANAKTALAAVDKNEMIIFSPKGETKAAVYVFSDPTCHYCQKLHQEIDKINANGIEVRYLAWPRSQQWQSLTENIWCSTDRHQAITNAKNGKKIIASSCANPVEKHMALGHSLGVSGTPAIFSESGMQIGGYLPANDLAKAAIANK